MQFIKAFALAGVTALGVSTCLAQEKTGCDGFTWPVNRELAAFAGTALPALSSGASIDQPTDAVALRLKPQDAVGFILPPEGKPKPGDSFGGILTISNLGKSGTYQVSMSGEGWIDVIQGGKALPAQAHSGRHDCAGVRKSVRFALGQGAVTIQVSGAKENVLKIGILPVE